MRWGKTYAEAAEAYKARKNARENWHKAFALFPKKTPEGWLWLEVAERKYVTYHGGWDDGTYEVAHWRRLRRKANDPMPPPAQRDQQEDPRRAP